MRANYTDVWYLKGQEISGSQKAVDLPFNRVSARAIIVRREDGSLLGTLHKQGGMYALPGGAVEDGESTLQAVIRELTEENINLINPEWLPSVAVDYFEGYCELSVWHIVLVEDADIGESDENIESRWITQDEDVWYPFMHENLVIALNLYVPGLAKAATAVQSI